MTVNSTDISEVYGTESRVAVFNGKISLDQQVKRAREYFNKNPQSLLMGFELEKTLKDNQIPIEFKGCKSWSFGMNIKSVINILMLNEKKINTLEKDFLLVYHHQCDPYSHAKIIKKKGYKEVKELVRLEFAKHAHNLLINPIKKEGNINEVV